MNSITQTIDEQLTVSKITRDFLLKARNWISHDGSDSLSNYYRLKINSLLDPDQDDIDAILKVSERNLRCSKCGIVRNLIYSHRRRQNKSRLRKNCRHLGSHLIECCDICKDKTKFSLSKRDNLPVAITDTPQIQQTNPPRKLVNTNAQTSKPEHNLQVKKYIKKGSSKPQPVPQFSSRLRNITCLLKQ